LVWTNISIIYIIFIDRDFFGEMLMNVSLIKIGSRLELELASNLGDKSYTYVSQLMGVIDEKNIVLAAPIHGSRVIFIPANAKLKVVFL